MSTCVAVSLFLSLPFQVVSCFRLKYVHHTALPGLQGVLVGGRAGCLRHTGILVGTQERDGKGKYKFIQRW